MVERWEDEYPSPSPLLITSADPEREDIVVSIAHKVAVLAAVVAIILGLWAMTSQPATSSETADATLGPPIANPANLARSGGAP